MSQIIAIFDPSAAASGKFPLSELSNGIGTIILWNESNWQLDITFPNGDVDIAAAWTASIFETTGPQGQVTWTQDFQLNSAMPPASTVKVIAYQSSQHIAGNYPLALVRQTTVGNVVSTAGGAVEFVQNDVSAAATTFIESTVLGDSASAVNITVAGVVSIGSAANKGSITLKGPISTDGAAITTDGAGNITKVKNITSTGNIATSGNISTSAGTLTVNGTSSLDNTTITTNGAGVLTTKGLSVGTNGALIGGSGLGITAGGLGVTGGSTSLDNGAIITDANGRITSTGTNDALTLSNGAIAVGGRTVTFNGNTSGNGILYQIMDGAGYKITYIHLNAVNNSGGTNTDIVLPVAYLEGAEFFVSNIGQIQCMASGVAQTFQIITALAAAGGTNTNQTTLNNYSWAHVGGTPFDTIRLSSGIALAHSGAITIHGR